MHRRPGTHGLLIRCMSGLVLSASLIVTFASTTGSATEQEVVPQELAQKAWTHGTIPVVVHLGVLTTPEGFLLDSGAVATQRQDIAATQGWVLSALTGLSHQVRHQYETLPFLALEVGPDALNMLEALRGLVVKHSLSYTWTASCPTLGSNGSFNNPALQTPTWTAPVNATGSQHNCTIAVTVSDGQGLSQSPSYSQGVSPVGQALILTGPGPGGGPHVRAFNADGSPRGPGLLAYDPAFTGGVRVAACDFDGDGRAEIVTSPGPGGGPHLRVIKVDTAGNPIGDLASVFAYNPAFTGGVFVACGDVDGDGVPEIITGPDAGGGPHVRVLKLQAGVPGGVVPFPDFFAYDPAFPGGVRVAAGNLDGSDRASIVLAPGPGRGPQVRAVKFTGGTLVDVANFFAYAPTFTGGVFVAAGNVTGDPPGGDRGWRRTGWRPARPRLHRHRRRHRD
jgi:hypothetical protein